MTLSIQIEPNENPDFVNILATCFNGLIEMQLDALQAVDNETIAKVVSEFEIAADKIVISKDEMGVQVKAGLSSARFSGSEIEGIKHHVTGLLHRLRKSGQSPA